MGQVLWRASSKDHPIRKIALPANGFHMELSIDGNHAFVVPHNATIFYDVSIADGKSTTIDPGVPITRILASLDGRSLLIGSLTAGVRIFDLKSQTFSNPILEGEVFDLALSKDGPFLPVKVGRA